MTDTATPAAAPPLSADPTPDAPRSALMPRRILVAGRTFLPEITFGEVIDGGSAFERVLATVGVREVLAGEEAVQGPAVVTVELRLTADALAEISPLRWAPALSPDPRDRQTGFRGLDRDPFGGRFGLASFFPPPVMRALDERYAVRGEVSADRQKEAEEDAAREVLRTGIAEALRAWEVAELGNLLLRARRYAEHAAKVKAEKDTARRVAAIVDKLRRHGGLDDSAFSLAFLGMNAAQENRAGRALAAILTGRKVRIWDDPPEAAEASPEGSPDRLAGELLDLLDVKGDYRVATLNQVRRLSATVAKSVGGKFLDVVSAYAQGVKASKPQSVKVATGTPTRKPA